MLALCIWAIVRTLATPLTSSRPSVLPTPCLLRGSANRACPPRHEPCSDRIDTARTIRRRRADARASIQAAGVIAMVIVVDTQASTVATPAPTVAWGCLVRTIRISTPSKLVHLPCVIHPRHQHRPCQLPLSQPSTPFLISLLLSLQDHLCPIPFRDPPL